MPSKYFDQLISQRRPETKIFVSKYLDIVERINEILKAKGMTQRDLASLMEKRESEVSRWLKGEHNLTLKSIAKLEAALGEDIITIPHTDFLEWGDTKITHMKVRINKDFNVDPDLTFHEPVLQKPSKKYFAS